MVSNGARINFEQPAAQPLAIKFLTPTIIAEDDDEDLVFLLPLPEDDDDDTTFDTAKNLLPLFCLLEDDEPVFLRFDEDMAAPPRSSIKEEIDDIVESSLQ